MTRGLIELARSVGTHVYLPEQPSSTCLCGNPRRRLNLQLGALGPTLSVQVPYLGNALGVVGYIKNKFSFKTFDFSFWKKSCHLLDDFDSVLVWAKYRPQWSRRWQEVKFFSPEMDETCLGAFFDVRHLLRNWTSSVPHPRRQTCIWPLFQSHSLTHPQTHSLTPPLTHTHKHTHSHTHTHSLTQTFTPTPTNTHVYLYMYIYSPFLSFIFVHTDTIALSLSLSHIHNTPTHKHSHKHSHKHTITPTHSPKHTHALFTATSRHQSAKIEAKKNYFLASFSTFALFLLQRMIIRKRHIS